MVRGMIGHRHEWENRSIQDLLDDNYKPYTRFNGAYIVVMSYLATMAANEDNQHRRDQQHCWPPVNDIEEQNEG